MPSWRALAVIIWAKRCSEPPRNSPVAVDMSLADLVISAKIASSTRSDWPGLRPILVGGSAAALAEIGMRVSRLMRPCDIASKVRYSVIILVSEAGNRLPLDAASNRVLPVLASITIAA